MKALLPAALALVASLVPCSPIVAQAPLRGTTFALGDGATLALGAESRVRLNVQESPRLTSGPTASDLLWRGSIGAELRLDPSVRLRAELASGASWGDSAGNPASVTNSLALQQAFVGLHREIEGVGWAAVLGRQEFSEGPRQLMSVGDGANVRRSWNGVHLSAHTSRLRGAAFGFCATRLGEHGLDERIDCVECLRGAHGSWLAVARSGEASLSIDPFWYRTDLPAVSLGGQVAPDERDTFGVRAWGREGRYGFDVTLARQVGEHGGREVHAFGLFARQELRLWDASAAPSASLAVDVASGGRSSDGTRLRTFHPLYSSSSYLGEGRLLSLANLVRIAPGLSLAPTPRTRLTAELGWAWRFSTDDSAYGLGFRPYAGSAQAEGGEVGRTFRLEGRWSDGDGLALALGFERLEVAADLRDAGLSSGGFAFASVTFRQ